MFALMYILSGNMSIEFIRRRQEVLLLYYSFYINRYLVNRLIVSRYLAIRKFTNPSISKKWNVSIAIQFMVH